MKKKILVVDDEISSVELLTGILNKDYEVIAAYDGNEALLKVKTNFPDLILLDIMMPDINGFDVCRLLKDDEKTMSIPIVMVTALNRKEDRIKAIEAGADDFLNKPVDMDILYAKVKSLLTVKSYYDNLMHGNNGILNNNQEVPKIEHPLLQTNPRLEDIVKNHLEIIILKMISTRPMCGYDLIKEIFADYNVLLSQGTVYPFLYSLKVEGILHAEFMKGDMRTKRYSPTQEGKQMIEKKFNDFIKAEEYILNSLKK
ncbi:MAG: response regulator [Candidatus Methanoperedens sp.]